MMKKIWILLAVLTSVGTATAQRHVSQERMAEVYEEVRTPYKYGLVVAPETNKAKIDCPTVFRENGRW